MAAGFSIGEIPSSAFKSQTREHFFKSVANEVFKNLGKVIRQKSGAPPTEEELKKAVQDGIRAAEERKLAIDPMGHLHLPECRELGRLKAGLKAASDVREIAFKAALEQRLKTAPCCFPAVEEQKQPAPQAPNPATRGGRKPSPLEIIGRMSREQQKQFGDWLANLTEEERGRIIDDLRALDSEAEFTGFMAMDPETRVQMLPLLEERKKQLEMIGKLIESGFAKAAGILKKGWSEFEEFDAKFKDEADELERELKTIEKKQTFWQKFSAIILPSPF